MKLIDIMSVRFPALAAAVFSVSGAFAQDVDQNTYYYEKASPDLDLAASWKLSDGSAAPADVSASTNLVFDKITWLNYYVMPIVNSINVNA